MNRNTRKGAASAIGLVVLAVLIVAGVVGYSSAYVLDETEQAVIAQFGELQEPVTEPGLHFKVPFVQEVRRIEKRLLAWDGNANQVLTEGQERIYIDTTARWRITDPRQFLETLNDEASAQSRLDGIIDSAVRDHISEVELEEVVRSADWQPEHVPAEGQQDGDGTGQPDASQPKEGAGGASGQRKKGESPTEAIKRVAAQRDIKTGVDLGREKILERIVETAGQTIEASGLGIELVDVRLKRINFIDSVRKKVYDRMIAERERVAAEYVSEGEARSAEILGQMQRQLAEIQSDAKRKADVIRGQAEGRAAEIYADAYGQDEQFYGFYRTLQAYREAIDSDVRLFLGADSRLLRYLRGPSGEGNAVSGAGGPAEGGEAE